MTTLKQNLIRLGSIRPDLRPHIRPLLVASLVASGSKNVPYQMWLDGIQGKFLEAVCDKVVSAGTDLDDWRYKPGRLTLISLTSGKGASRVDRVRLSFDDAGALVAETHRVQRFEFSELRHMTPDQIADSILLLGDFGRQNHAITSD